MFSIPSNSRVRIFRTLTVVFGIVGLSAALRSQAINRVSGLVTDQSGAVIVGATVTAQDVATNVVTTTTSNDRGYYLLQVPIGVYDIKASNAGFRTSLREKVEVSVGADVGINFELSLATAGQSMEVVGGIAPLLAPNSASVETTVENQLVMNLPLAVSGGIRNSADFLKLTPGYQGCSFSARLNGGVGLDQEVTIDGATVSPVAFGAGIQGAQNTVPGFAVQEFQVVGSNIEAQYGRTSTASSSTSTSPAPTRCTVPPLNICGTKR